MNTGNFTNALNVVMKRLLHPLISNTGIGEIKMADKAPIISEEQIKSTVNEWYKTTPLYEALATMGAKSQRDADHEYYTKIIEQATSNPSPDKVREILRKNLAEYIYMAMYHDGFPEEESLENVRFHAIADDVMDYLEPSIKEICGG